MSTGNPLQSAAAHPRPLTRTYTWLDRAPPAVLLALAIAFLVLGQDFPPASGQVPIMIGWAMIVLTVLDLASRLNNSIGMALTRWLSPAALTEEAERIEKNEARPDRRRQFTAIGAIVVFMLMLVYLGVMISVPIFTFVAIKFGARFGWVTTIIGAAATTGIIWLLFAFLLRLQLFPGVLFGGS